jgi:hypothetical protein
MQPSVAKASNLLILWLLFDNSRVDRAATLSKYPQEEDFNSGVVDFFRPMRAKIQRYVTFGLYAIVARRGEREHGKHRDNPSS